MVDRQGNEEPGIIQYSNWASNSSQWSNFALDRNGRDPDGMRIHMELSSNNVLFDTDFRIGLRAVDHSGRGELGTPQYTPWFSEGGGWSTWAYDANGRDPDGFQVIVETRPLPSNFETDIENFRIGLQATDQGTSETGAQVFTSWINHQTQNGGYSAWAFDVNSYDPDAFQIGIDVDAR